MPQRGRRIGCKVPAARAISSPVRRFGRRPQGLNHFFPNSRVACFDIDPHDHPVSSAIRTVIVALGASRRRSLQHLFARISIRYYYIPHRSLASLSIIAQSFVYSLPVASRAQFCHFFSHFISHAGRPLISRTCLRSNRRRTREPGDVGPIIRPWSRTTLYASRLAALSQLAQ